MHFPSDLIEIIRTARWIAVLTGAGISAESGVPTFREAQTGLWAIYDPQQLATPGAFRRDPRLVWEWYAWRRELVSKAPPNPGHQALVRMQSLVPQFTLITQNVDGLHQCSGSQQVIELHGNLQRVKCFDRHHPVLSWEENGELPPRCPVCGSYLRPDVVWFGENLPQEALQSAIQAARYCDLFFSIGTSSLVEPAASLPWMALENGAVVVEVNPTETPLTQAASFVLSGPSGTILPALVETAWG